MASRRERFPGYDVLSKRDGPSWNEATRRAIDERLAVRADDHDTLDDAAWRTLRALCDRIIPQPPDRADPVPIAALVARTIARGPGDGYRHRDMPPVREAWERGLAAIEAEARERHGLPFAAIGPDRQDDLLRAVQAGDAHEPAWAGMPPKTFFASRILKDVVAAYYGHPTAWNEIGFGGPASPRGYVRTGFNRRDPWEAVEAASGREDEARAENSLVR